MTAFIMSYTSAHSHDTESKKKRNAKSSIEEIIYVITAFSIAKMAVFKITVFPRTSNFFFPTNSPVTLLKKSFKCHLKTVYADCICFW